MVDFDIHSFCLGLSVGIWLMLMLPSLYDFGTYIIGLFHGGYSEGGYVEPGDVCMMPWPRHPGERVYDKGDFCREGSTEASGVNHADKTERPRSRPTPRRP